MDKVLVVAAHPDDEVLGCGATVARHVNNGDHVSILIVGEGSASRDNHKSEYIETLKRSAQEASAILGVKSLYFGGLSDNRMDAYDRLTVIKLIEKYIQDICPSIVYTHHVGDVNIDHQVVHHSVVTACRPLPGLCVRRLLFFEVVSSTEWQLSGSGATFQPNLYVDISETLEHKLRALSAYRSEMRPWPHARSSKAIENLALWRGSNAGVTAAESFMIGREIVRLSDDRDID